MQRLNKILPALCFLIIAGAPLARAAETVPNHIPDWAMGGFVRPQGVNPVISPREDTPFKCPASGATVLWESNDTFNPASAVKGDKLVVIYRAEDKYGEGIGKRTSRLGYAESTDGINFKRRPEPVFYPDKDSQHAREWPGGSEDPRIAVTEDGTYVLFYTQWNRDKARLGVALSKDLIKWEKHGSIFEKAHGGKFYNTFHKSASIVTKVKNGRQVIEKINGKYFMYWGEYAVYAATSDDLINWEPVLNREGKLLELIKPRKKHFDSVLTECGPPAVVTDHGILLLYNGKNGTDKDRDPRFNGGTYAAGQVLFSQEDPLTPIARLEVPFFRPLEDFEKSGQYRDGTVFIEGLSYFKGKWYLYYGCADSKVGVAIFDPKNPGKGDSVPVLRD